MATTLPNLVVGIDVGGTNTDTVLMDGKEVLGWHKVPTTHDLGKGVSTSIAEVLRKTGIAPDGVAVVKIGTTVGIHYLERIPIPHHVMLINGCSNL